MRFVFCILLFIPLIINAQDSIPKRLSLNGYISNTQSFMFDKWDGDWTSDNLIHNRLNFQWNNRNGNWNAVVELRNRLFSGESVEIIPGYAKMVESDNGYKRLSFNIASGKSYLINSKIDRAYISYNKDRFRMKIGRQRINWGQCITWNPNDLFNSSSFFDFDYIEKPGSDALRIQYFASSTSALDISAKVDNQNKATIAALYRFNRLNYDIQIIGGLLSENDYVIGAGWSGEIKGASFRGEVSYFQPKNNFTDTTGVLVVSLGSEYSFPNSFRVQYEILYNKIKGTEVRNFAEFYTMNLSAKKLSFTDLSMLLEGSYPITPLFNATLSVMYLPKIKGYFIGPTLSYSLTENIEFSLIAQSFSGEIIKGERDNSYLGFLRLKLNF